MGVTLHCHVMCMSMQLTKVTTNKCCKTRDMVGVLCDMGDGPNDGNGRGKKNSVKAVQPYLS